MQSQLNPNYHSHMHSQHQQQHPHSIVPGSNFSGAIYLKNQVVVTHKDFLSPSSNTSNYLLLSLLLIEF